MRNDCNRKLTHRKTSGVRWNARAVNIQHCLCDVIFVTSFCIAKRVQSCRDQNGKFLFMRSKLSLFRNVFSFLNATLWSCRVQKRGNVLKDNMKTLMISRLLILTPRAAWFVSGNQVKYYEGKVCFKNTTFFDYLRKLVAKIHWNAYTSSFANSQWWETIAKYHASEKKRHPIPDLVTNLTHDQALFRFAW